MLSARQPETTSDTQLVVVQLGTVTKLVGVWVGVDDVGPP